MCIKTKTKTRVQYPLLVRLPSTSRFIALEDVPENVTSAAEDDKIRDNQLLPHPGPLWLIFQNAPETFLGPVLFAAFFAPFLLSFFVSSTPGGWGCRPSDPPSTLHLASVATPFPQSSRDFPFPPILRP